MKNRWASAGEHGAGQVLAIELHHREPEDRHRTAIGGRRRPAEPAQRRHQQRLVVQEQQPPAEATLRVEIAALLLEPGAKRRQGTRPGHLDEPVQRGVPAARPQSIFRARPRCKRS
jgi:hypothetical protein